LLVQGLVNTEESKAKIAAFLFFFYFKILAKKKEGYKHTEESKAKMSEPLKAPKLMLRTLNKKSCIKIEVFDL
jgi:hypothetical protein